MTGEPRSPGESGPPAGGRAAGFRRAAAGEVSAASVLDGIGGPLGVVEGVVPSLAFLVLWVATHQVLPSVLVPLVAVVGFLVWRLVRRQTVTAAVAGAVAAAASAILALTTRDAANAFVPGLLLNAAYGIVLLVSLLAGRPLIGLVAGLLTGDQDWRAVPARRRAYRWLTLLWLALFAVRLVVEVPLYLAHATDALAVARLVTGVPLYAPVLVLTLLGVRAISRGRAQVS